MGIVAFFVTYRIARLLRDCATSGCSGPSAFSRIAQCTLIQGLGLSIVGSFPVNVCQAVKRCCDIRVVWAKSLLAYRQSADVERLGLSIVASFVIQDCQAVERLRYVRVPSTKGFLTNCQSAFGKRQCSIISAYTIKPLNFLS